MIVGIVLLLFDMVGCATLLSGPRALSPETFGNLAGVALRLGVLSAVVAGLIPALRRRFAAWALVLFALPLLLFVASIALARQGNTRLAAQMTEAHGFFESFVRDAQRGQLHTGKALSPENPLAGVQALLADVARDLDSMEKDLQATGERDAFDLTVLANKPQLKEQIRVRRTQEEVLLRYRTALMAKIDGWKLDLSNSGLSPELQAGMRDGAQKGVARGKLGQAQMFALRLREVEAQEQFLEFMLGTFGEYRISGGKLHSPSAEWSETYHRLADAVTRVRKEQGDFAQAQASEAEKQLQRFKELTGGKE